MAISVKRIRKMVYIAVAAALATILSFVQFPYPVAPYMKFDPNDIVILICTVFLGWPSTVAVVLIRSLVRFLMKGGIFGEIAAISSSLIFMSAYALVRWLLRNSKTHRAVKYAIGCAVGVVVATIGLMTLNYLFITPSNIFQEFTTGFTLMEKWHMTQKAYFTQFIVPVMTFNLIKWSAISVITGLTQIKLPERFKRRFDSRETVEDQSGSNNNSNMKLEASIEK